MSDQSSSGVAPLLHLPKNRSLMKWHAVDCDGVKIVPLQITSPALPPNRWYRFWARVLLNVTWEKL